MNKLSSSLSFLFPICISAYSGLQPLFHITRHPSAHHAKFLPYSSATKGTSLLGSKSASDQWSPERVALTDERRVNRRREIISTIASVTTSAMFLPASRSFAADDESFSSIAERAAALSRSIEESEEKQKQASDLSMPATKTMKEVPAYLSKNAYDYTLPIAEVQVPFKEVIHQSYDDDGVGKVKAVLVVFIKQDDAVARRNIAELVSLGKKYGEYGLSVISIPTDQGYYEPDTSQLMRLKLATEYGYNPTSKVLSLTDKIDILGTGSHPFARWIQGSCRTPSGLGKIQQNFEKFLIDANTGKPLRRYPRKYDPNEIRPDIEALLATSGTANGGKLPPPSGNFYEMWRSAVKDAETDTYRFQKGLNVFDQ